MSWNKASILIKPLFLLIFAYYLLFVETAKKKIQRAENANQEDITKLEPIEADTKDIPSEKKTKKSKKKSKKKVEIPKDDILTEKALQRASEIIEMLSD